MQETSEHGRKALRRGPLGSSCIPRRGGGHGVVLFFALLALLSGGGTQAASSGPKHRTRQGHSAVSSSVVAWRDGLQQWGRAGAAGGLRTRGCFASLPIPPASSPVRDVRGRDVRCGVMWSTVLTKWPGLFRPSLSARFSPPSDTGAKAGVGLLTTRGGASAVAAQTPTPTPHPPTAIIDIDTHQLSSSLSQHEEHLHDSHHHDSPPKPLAKEVVSLGLNPSLNGSLWDLLAFKWVDPLMKRGNGKPLEMSDLWELRDEDSMATLSTRFQEVYGVEAERAVARNVSAWDGRRSTWMHSPLIRSLWVIFKKPLVVTGVIRLLASFAQFCPALLVNRLLRVLEAGSGMDVTMGYRYSLLLALSLVAKTTLDNQFYHHTAVMSLQIRSLISTCVYRKSLRLSPAARQRSTVGEIVNMMQLDANRLDQVASSVHSVWSGALDIIGYLALLVHFMGPSMLAGIAIMVMVIPLNAGFLSLLAKCRERTLKFSDARVKLTNEVLQGMRSIKSYAWEGAFLNQLSDTRASELGTIQEAATLRAILVAFLGATPAIVAMVTIWAFVSLGKNVLSASRIFTAIALFNQLRFPLLFYPMVIAAVAEGRVALRRLQGFLDGEEVESTAPSTAPSHTTAEHHADASAPVFAHVTEASQVGISMKGAQFSYGTGNASATTAATGEGSGSGRLLNCTLSVRPGELVAVVGSLGSGKSSLVRAILGEMRLEGGEVGVKGKLAYVAQSAWVPNDSLRNAVLFGQSLDRTKYAHTLQACGLLPDLALLESGDATEVGERGVTLSGGQKQRLALARAVYHDADVYLLDDPLSALDAHVAKEVFEGCILRGPLSSKARLLVTNQLQFLPYVDKVIVMGAEEGGACRLLDQGTYQELRSRGFDLEALVKQQQQASLTEGATEEAQAPAAVAEAEPLSEVSPSEPEMPTAAKEEGPKEEGSGGKVEVMAKAAKKLMKDEERLTGAVKKEVYMGYLKAVRSPLLLGLTVLAYVVANATQFLQQAVISAWTADPLHLKHGASWYLGGVSAMALLVALGNYLRTYLTVLAGVRASKQLHLDSLRRVLRAPMRYFDSTPVGQLLQRFSTDMDQVDQQLPGSLGMFIMCVLQIAGSLGAILAATPLFAVCVLPLSLIYLSVMNYFRNVTRELKRLDSLARSPIFSHLSETLGGLSIIRAFKRERHFIASNEKKVDASVRAHFALKAGDRWLSVRLELLGNVVVLVGGLLAVQAASRGKLGAGLAGLAITNALGVTGLLNWAVRCLAETEAQMNSVERIQTLIHRIPHEAPEIVEPLSTEPPPLHHDQVSPPPSSATSASNPIAAVPLRALQGDSALVGSGWPWQGGLYLRNVVLRYREESDAVLHGLSVAIRPREKIGIVGRTGAGKSSLFVALLRLVEAESGSMEIDGVDISTVGLSTLRSAITVIPQDPVLFSGTIRSNLDPFGRYDDLALWEALRKASLDKLVRGLPGQLESSVAEYGENLSCGQRQLLCLARALLRKSRILLLDEATSSVDYETDAIIQRTIRREFGDVTVLTIAHRLKTILDSSRIMVMKNGRLAEIDTPKALLARPNSLFSQLVRSSESSSDILRDAPLPQATQTQTLTQTLQPTAA